MHRQPIKRSKVPTRSIQPTQGGNYLRKAEQHLALALQALADSRWDSTVLLSVHAAISAADAVCVGKHGLRSVSPSHADLVKLLRELFPKHDATIPVTSQLAALIDRKNTVEYEARLCTQKDAEVAAKQAERIVHWARTMLSE